MIPQNEALESLGYDLAEIDAIASVREVVRSLPESERWHFVRNAQQQLWPDSRQRLERTTIIQTKQDGRKLMKLNVAQGRFYEDVLRPAVDLEVPVRVIICKARQLGFSTLMQAWHYFMCAEFPNRNSLTVSYDRMSTGELFQKALGIHHSQWFSRPTIRSSTDVLEFKSPHYSMFLAKTAGSENTGRGLTVNHLHLSEVAMYDHAEAVVAAAHATVPLAPRTSIVWESTARGAQGMFYEAWQKAEAGEGMTPFFAPWFWEPGYSLPFASADHRRQFARKLVAKESRMMDRLGLTLEQMHFRAKKIATEMHGNDRLFQQEYPSSAQEAFLTSGSPVFDPERITEISENVVDNLWRGDVLLEMLDL